MRGTRAARRGTFKMPFDPSEPRDDHGEWTTGGGIATGANAHRTVGQAAFGRRGATVQPAATEDGPRFTHKIVPNRSGAWEPTQQQMIDRMRNQLRGDVTVYKSR